VKLIIEAEKCSGCRLCEMACTNAHENNYGSRAARIRVVKIESQGIDYPVTCQRCANPPCVRACPTGALTQDPTDRVIRVNESLCTGCGSCVKACPFGACNLHPRAMVALICDLCGGAPACAEACPTGAISSISDEGLDCAELARLAQAKRDRYAERMCRPMLERWRKR